MSQENVEIVRRASEAFERGDLPAALAALDPNLVVHRAPPLPDARTYHGHAGMAQAFVDWTEGFSDLVITTEEFIDAGDKVITRVRAKGRGASSGVAVDGEFWFVYAVDGAKIRRLDLFNQRGVALEAAGLSE
jgi:ketosteroid isomerase-like protein